MELSWKGKRRQLFFVWLRDIPFFVKIMIRLEQYDKAVVHLLIAFFFELHQKNYTVGFILNRNNCWKHLEKLLTRGYAGYEIFFSLIVASLWKSILMASLAAINKKFQANFQICVCSQNYFCGTEGPQRVAWKEMVLNLPRHQSVFIHQVQSFWFTQSRTRHLSSDLCGRCTSTYEISLVNNSLKLVKKKADCLPYCCRAVHLILLNVKTKWWGEESEHVLQVSSSCGKKISFDFFYTQMRQK